MTGMSRTTGRAIGEAEHLAQSVEDLAIDRFVAGALLALCQPGHPMQNVDAIGVGIGIQGIGTAL